jgi:hypothetical protein
MIGTEVGDGSPAAWIDNSLYSRFKLYLVLLPVLSNYFFKKSKNSINFAYFPRFLKKHSSNNTNFGKINKYSS